MSTSDIFPYYDLVQEMMVTMERDKKLECWVPCHCDLFPGNILYSPVDTKIIDWERAGLSYRGLDIVIWAFTDENVKLGEVGLYLQKYLPSLPRDIDRIRYLLKVWTVYGVGWSAKYETEYNRKWLYEGVEPIWKKFHAYEELMGFAAE